MTGWIPRASAASATSSPRYRVRGRLGLCGPPRSPSDGGFRLIQGAAGAAMIPSQAILMETFPPSEQQMAMAIWGMGMMPRRSWARRSAAGSPTTGTGAGTSTSTCRSARSRFDGLHLRARSALYRSGDPAARSITSGSLPGLRLGCMHIVLDRGQRADWFRRHGWCGRPSFGSSRWCFWFGGAKFISSDPTLNLKMLLDTVCSPTAVSLVRGAELRAVRHRLAESDSLTGFFMGYTAWRGGLPRAPRAIGAMAAMLFAGPDGAYWLRH